MTPRELGLARKNGQISTELMMTLLSAESYTSGLHDPTGGDGYIRGTWDEIQWLLMDDLITDEEYTFLALHCRVSN